MFKNFKFPEFGDDIQNLHEKCIEISTNMPGIGLVFPEIAFDISEFVEDLESGKCACMAELSVKWKPYLFTW